MVARANAEATLASRAIDGVEEEIRYHGEVVGTRIRYSDRLLLAHLGRLDKLAETPAAGAFAEDFDNALEGFGRGEVFAASAIGEPSMEVPASAGTQHCKMHRAPAQAGASHGSAPTGDFSSPGPCNTRSMSYTPGEEDWDEDGIDWEDEEACAAELARIAAAMEADRPADAPRLTGLGPDGQDRDPHRLIADAQWEAFARRVPRWWLVVPPAPYRGKGEWHYADADPGPPNPPAPCDEPERSDDDRPEPDSEPKPEVKSEPEQEVEHEFEPQPEPVPQPEPGQPPASPPAGTPRDDRPRWAWSPVNDGRLQPFYGRYL